MVFNRHFKDLDDEVLPDSDWPAEDIGWSEEDIERAGTQPLPFQEWDEPDKAQKAE